MPGSPLPTQPAGTYNVQQVEALWIQYGGSVATAPVAAAVALAESGGRPDATNHNTNGSIDRGLFQINSVHGAQSSTDLATNVKAAIAISNNGTNWRPWTTFTSGAYKQFLGQAQDAIKTLDTGHSTLDQVLNAPGAAISAVGDVASGVGNIATLLTSTAFWLRLGEAIAGLLLLYLGLHALTGNSNSLGDQARHVRTRFIPI